ncbi:hypothetical protein [Streptomyces albicerus]|uniref:hypothetical protein n=1 Tax=Streptomyces albicerus TaxID=2569859 RepID=UPI00124B16D3|nr:hypothetical protein [Streptomyces albicerus]
MRGRRARRRNSRALLWGPADYFGRPPTGLVAEGVLVAFLGTVLIVGSSAVGSLTGSATLRSGAAGVVCALALALYLLIVRAGRALVGAVVVTGLALSVLVPRVTAEITLAERGQRQEVIVTAVQTARSPGSSADRSCSFAREDGVPVPVPIRRGCQAYTTVGDRITAVFDPQGVITPRAVGRFRLGRLIGTGALALVLPGLCLIAVVRSYRIPSHGARPYTSTCS